MATDEAELPRLQNIYERGQANGLSGLKMLSAAEVRIIPFRGEYYMCGYTVATVAAAAMAASRALPPARSAATPDWVASRWGVATM